MDLEMALINPITLRMTKTQWSFGHSECNRFKWSLLIFSSFLLQTLIESVLVCTHNLCFLAKIKKYVYACKPDFSFYKVRLHCVYYVDLLTSCQRLRSDCLAGYKCHKTFFVFCVFNIYQIFKCLALSGILFKQYLYPLFNAVKPPHLVK